MWRRWHIREGANLLCTMAVGLMALVGGTDAARMMR